MKWRGPAGIVLLAFVAGGLALRWQQQAGHDATDPGTTTADVEANRLRIGDPSPPLALPDVDGRVLDLNLWRGQRILLNFWATWCPPCRAEMPRLSAAQSRRIGQGVQIIGVAVDDARSVRRWLVQHGSSYPLLLDEPEHHPVTSRFGNPRAILPYSVLIGPDGRIERRAYGVLSEARIEDWLGPARQPDLGPK